MLSDTCNKCLEIYFCVTEPKDSGTLQALPSLFNKFKDYFSCETENVQIILEAGMKMYENIVIFDTIHS